MCVLVVLMVSVSMPPAAAPLPALYMMTELRMSPGVRLVTVVGLTVRVMWFGSREVEWFVVRSRLVARWLVFCVTESSRSMRHLLGLVLLLLWVFRTRLHLLGARMLLTCRPMLFILRFATLVIRPMMIPPMLLNIRGVQVLHLTSMETPMCMESLGTILMDMFPAGLEVLNALRMWPTKLFPTLRMFGMLWMETVMTPLTMLPENASELLSLRLLLVLEHTRLLELPAVRMFAELLVGLVLGARLMALLRAALPASTSILTSVGRALHSTPYVSVC